MTRYKFALMLDKTTEVVLIGHLYVDIESDTEIRSYAWVYADDLPESAWWANLQGLEAGDIHSSTALFNWFEERIPPKNRIDWQVMFGIDHYDEISIIQKTGLRLAEDTYYMKEIVL